jgi:hypothetical protein
MGSGYPDPGELTQDARDRVPIEPKLHVNVSSKRHSNLPALIL